MKIGALTAEATAGNLAAQAILGMCYLYGYDTPVDHAQAHKWLERAAKRGAPRARLHLGHMYRDGLGVAKDDAMAFELYELAAEGGEFDAQIAAARAYANGIGTALDVSSAAHWYNCALSQVDVAERDAELEEARAFVAKHNADI